MNIWHVYEVRMSPALSESSEQYIVYETRWCTQNTWHRESLVTRLGLLQMLKSCHLHLTNWCNCFYCFRLYTELNAEVKKHQGDFGVSRSADEIGKEFLTFFTSEMHEVLQGIQKTQKIPAREQLCCIFQVITTYNICWNTLFKCIIRLRQSVRG